MKLPHVALAALGGMLCTSLSVYAVVPDGGFGKKKRGREAEVSPVAEPEPSFGLLGGGQGGEKEVEHAVFKAGGGGLMVEGRLGHASLARTGGEELVLLEVSSDGSKATARPSVSLGIVIDRSGSMKGSRIQNAIRAAQGAVDRLADGDTVSVVSFDTQASVVVAPTPISSLTRESVRAAIQGIQLGGDTCVSCGLEESLRLVGQSPGQVSRVLLLSDGDANHGVRDVAGFRALGQRARDRGVPVSSIGVDLEFNEKILSALAQESNGRHYFVEDHFALARVFEQEAQLLASSVASNVEAVLELPEGVELDRVFDRPFRRDGSRVVVPLGSFGAGETKTVLARVKVRGGSEGLRDVVSVDVRYRDLGADRAGSCRGTLGAKLGDKVAELDPVVAGRFGRSETAAALKDANRLFEEGKASEARARLGDAKAKLAKAAAAPMATAAGRGESVRRDFDKQMAAIDGAETGFATPPPAAGAPAPAPVRAQQKRNVQNAFDMGF